MEDKRPILSICILTYNRKKYLKENIESIINQEWFSKENVEIIISDNVSTDWTDKLCIEFQKKYKNIKYFKNEKNVWPEKNCILALSRWKWEYLWTFWDDDLFEKWLLLKVFSVIKEKNPDFIICNFNKFIWPWPNKKITYKDTLKIKEDKHFTNKTDFFNFISYNNDPFFILSIIILFTYL